MLGKMPKMCSKTKMKMVNESEFDEFLSRISKTLYYGDEIMVEDHLSYPVIELAAEIYSDLKTGKSIDRLYLDEATEMTQKVKVNPCYMVLALIYIERLKDCNTEYLDNIAPSQLFLISLVLASKFHDDSEYELSLSMFDKFSDFSRSEIFQLELAFLSALQWKVSVSEEEFCGKLLQMEKLLAMKNANKRNWFTYTEMSTLLLDEAWTSQLTSLLVAVSAVCFTTYTAGVLTLFASSVLASHISSSAALVILSTTAQLSLLVPYSSSGTPPCNGTNSITSLPIDSIEEEAFEQEIIDRLLLDGETTLENLMSRMNFGNDKYRLRNENCIRNENGIRRNLLGFVDKGWNLKTKNNCIRNMPGAGFPGGFHEGSNPNFISTLDNNWNGQNIMVESKRNNLGFLGFNNGNMQGTTDCIRNIAWKNMDRDVQSLSDERKTTEKSIENDLGQYVSNADHTSIKMNSKQIPSIQHLDSELHDIPKAELILHSLINYGRSHSISKKDYQFLSTEDHFIGSDSNSQATCVGHNSKADSNELVSNCLGNSPLFVSQRKDCRDFRYNQNISRRVYGAFCLDNFQPDQENNVYESYEESKLSCKRTLGRNCLEKDAGSNKFDVELRRGYTESMLGYADLTEHDAELDHGYADSTQSHAELDHGYIESTLNTAELDHDHADSTQSHADSTQSSFIPLSFSNSFPLLSSLSDYLPPLKNISSLLLNQINNDLFSTEFKFGTSESTDEDRYRFGGLFSTDFKFDTSESIDEDRYRFVGIDSYYRTGSVYRRENDVEILSC